LYKFAGSGLQDIVRENQSNVGSVILDGNTRLLDPKDRDSKAERKLQALV
jgi:hypothetical protein